MSREMSIASCHALQRGTSRMTFKRMWTTVRLGIRQSLFCLTLGGLFAAPAVAHPDYWVSVKYLVSFSDTALTELELEWEFDVFYSSQAFNRYDLDRDGEFSEDEARALQSALFAPLAKDGYFVKVFGGASALPMQLGRFTPQIEEDRLVITFSLLPPSPHDYRDAALTFTTHDEGAFDFTLAESAFLKVKGTYDPTCRFRIGDGEGPLNGIPQTVFLICPE